MEIITLYKPFLHYIIHKFFTDLELIDIWSELDNFHKTNSFTTKEFTGDPSSTNKLGIVLDQHYAEDRTKSSILNHFTKVFKLSNLIKDKNLYNFLMDSNADLTFVSYYKNNSEYKHHVDFSSMSAVFTLWKEPQQFQGGNLCFKSNNYTPKLYSNSLIIFPSHQIHGVSKLTCDDNAIGSSRYSICKFISKIPEHI